MSVGVDFAVTQVVDGNWGVHAAIKKAVFAERVTDERAADWPATGRAPQDPPERDQTTRSR